MLIQPASKPETVPGPAVREYRGSVSVQLDAATDSVFDFITDVSKLPEWNAAIERVTESPDAMVPGAEWVVVMHPPKLLAWKSRSRVEEISRHPYRFVYRTGPVNSNQSYAIWTWHVAPAEPGTVVTVSWEVHPRGFMRRVVGSRVRQHPLEREVTSSLEAMRQALADR